MTHSVHSWLTTMGRPQCQNHDKSHAQLRNSEQRHRVELGFFPGSAFAHTARPIQRKLAYGMTLQKIAIFCFGDTFQFAQYKIAHEAISATFGKYERHNLLSRCGGRNQAPTAARNVPLVTWFGSTVDSLRTWSKTAHAIFNASFIASGECPVCSQAFKTALKDITLGRMPLSFMWFETAAALTALSGKLSERDS